jgi:cold-inducible RNA-binding protein
MEDKMRMFVGNLDLGATEDELAAAFQPFGTVVEVSVMKNYATGENHGYGYVEMANEAEANAAINALNGTEFLERELTVLRN